MLPFRGLSVAAQQNFHTNAHTIYKGLAVGQQMTCDSGQSTIVGSLGREMISYFPSNAPSGCQIIFHGPALINDTPEQTFTVWTELQAMFDRVVAGSYERTVRDSYSNYKVIVVDQDVHESFLQPQACGGARKYTMEDFRLPAGRLGFIVHAEDQGATLIVFKGSNSVCLGSTEDGRPFGPSVVAMNANVYVDESVSFVDGVIVAKNVQASGTKLQLHGDMYSGPLMCLKPQCDGVVKPTTDTAFSRHVSGAYAHAS